MSMYLLGFMSIALYIYPLLLYLSYLSSFIQLFILSYPLCTKGYRLVLVFLSIYPANPCQLYFLFFLCIYENICMRGVCIK